MFGLVLRHRSSCAAKLSRPFLRLLLGQRLELADVPGLEERTSRSRLVDSFTCGCGPQWIVTDAVTMWTRDLRTAEEWAADRSTSERADLDVAQVHWQRHAHGHVRRSLCRHEYRHAIK